MLTYLSVCLSVCACLYMSRITAKVDEGPGKNCMRRKYGILNTFITQESAMCAYCLIYNWQMWHDKPSTGEKVSMGQPPKFLENSPKW